MRRLASLERTLNWNKVLTVTFGLAVLTGLVLHQGQVELPGADDEVLMTGTALRASTEAAPGNDKKAESAGTADCRKEPDAAAAGQEEAECSKPVSSKKLAHNDPVR
jgi:hypothetical protein